MNYNYLSHAALDLYTPYLLYYEPIDNSITLFEWRYVCPIALSKRCPNAPSTITLYERLFFLTIYSVTLSIPKYIRVKYLPRTYTSNSWSSEAPDFSFQMSTRPLRTKLILPPPKCAPPFSGHYNN